MAETVTIGGGAFDLVIPKANPEASDAVTGDKANVTNMMLARGFLLVWDYGERILSQTAVVETDLAELDAMRAYLAQAVDWKPETFKAQSTDATEVARAAAERSTLLVTLKQYGVVDQRLDGLIDASTGFTMTSGLFFSGGPSTADDAGTPITDTWATLNPANYTLISSTVYQTSDGVLFTVSGGVPRVLDWSQVASVQTPDDMSFSQQDLEAFRRGLELAIERKTQFAQNKQAFLQDLTGNLEKWHTLVSALLDRRKRDADAIVGNYKA
jgi:hypothetical protein